MALVSRVESRNISRPRPILLLRADSGQEQGFGHVMRCITLGAEFVSQGWEVQFLSSTPTEFLVERARREGIEMRELMMDAGSIFDAQRVADLEADLVVVDGYHFPASYFSVLDSQSVRYVVIDDNGVNVSANAEFIINQNPHADRSMYQDTDPRRLLIGPQFALVRREILDLRSCVKASEQQSTPLVLVSIGGTDIGGSTRGIASALVSMTDAVVVASGIDPPEGVSRAPADIAPILAMSTCAVLGAGTSMWEAAHLGVPVVAIVVADNQFGAATRASELGICEMIDFRSAPDLDQVRSQVQRLLASPSKRKEMAMIGRSLIDGEGAARVAKQLIAARNW